MLVQFSNFILAWPILGIPACSALYLATFFADKKFNRVLRLIALSVPGFIIMTIMITPSFEFWDDVIASIVILPTNLLSFILLIHAITILCSKSNEKKKFLRSEIVYFCLLALAYLYEQWAATALAS